MKKIILFAAIAAIGLVACNKSDVENQPTMQKAPAVDLGSLNNGERIFTDDQIEQIGKNHNEAVTKMINDFNYNAEDIHAALVEQISQYDIYHMELAELPLGVSTEKYYSDVLQANFSEQAHKFIYDVADVCVELGSVNEVEQYIEKQKVFAKGYFKGVELDCVLAALTVFKYSSQLWFDIEEGGMGLGVIFADNCERTGMFKAPTNTPMRVSAETKEKLKKCLMADGVAAADAIVVASIIAVCAPTLFTVAGALVGIGISAAWSSLYKLVDILLYGAPSIDPNKPDVVLKWKDYIMVDGKLITRPILVDPYFPIK